MICPICHKREAICTITRKFGGTTVQGEVCNECYVSASFMPQEGFYYTFLQRPNLKCRSCGRTLGEIENTLLVGCQHCYTQFKEELKPLINELQGMNSNED